jgi:sortase A
MALRRLGRSFVALGVLILLFLAYQLFGTNYVTGRHQEALASEFSGTTVVDAKPDLGEGIAIIKIPSISVDKIVVEGTEVEDLKKGPGHYQGTAFPGEAGNVVISGHRTTYGAPFFNLDKLIQNDAIFLIDKDGTSYKYLVTESKVVKPTDVAVVNPTTDARLTLTTCNPKFSARERLIIVAALQGTPRAHAAGA